MLKWKGTYFSLCKKYNPHMILFKINHVNSKTYIKIITSEKTFNLFPKNILKAVSSSSEFKAKIIILLSFEKNLILAYYY